MWHVDVGWEPGKCVSDAFCGGFNNPHTVAAVVVAGWTEVPAVNSMWGPGAAGGRFFMDKDAGARGSQWGAVEIKCAMDLGPG